MGEGGGTISAEGGQYPLADYVRGGQNPLADYVRGDKICGGTKSAPTPALLRNPLTWNGAEQRIQAKWRETTEREMCFNLESKYLITS